MLANRIIRIASGRECYQQRCQGSKRSEPRLHHIRHKPTSSYGRPVEPPSNGNISLREDDDTGRLTQVYSVPNSLEACRKENHDSGTDCHCCHSAANPFSGFYQGVANVA